MLRRMKWIAPGKRFDKGAKPQPLDLPASCSAIGAMDDVFAGRAPGVRSLLPVDAPGVLILTPFYEPNIGGVETHLKDLVEFLRKDGRFEVFVLTYRPLTTRAKWRLFENDGQVRVLRLPWPGFGIFHRLEKYPLLSFLYLAPWLLLWTAALLAVKGRSIGTVHAQGFNAAFIARLLARPFGRRFIASTHAVYGLKAGTALARAVRWTLSGAHNVLALSEASKKELVGIGLPEKAVQTYTYWIDQRSFRPRPREAAKAALGWEGRFVVLFVGRLIEAKGIDLLLEAAEGLEAVTFAFIGDGPLAGRLRRAGQAKPNVIFPGKVANRELPRYYCAADLLCVPSRNEEGFGRVILEALSCGTPVVATRRGGIPEALESTVGVLVEPSASEIGRAIEGLWKAPTRLAEMQGRSRAYALERFGEGNALTIVGKYQEGEG